MNDFYGLMGEDAPTADSEDQWDNFLQVLNNLGCFLFESVQFVLLFCNARNAGCLQCPLQLEHLFVSTGTSLNLKRNVF